VNAAIFHYRTTLERTRFGHRWFVDFREEIPEGVGVEDTHAIVHWEGRDAPKGWCFREETAQRQIQNWIFSHRSWHGYPAYTVNDRLFGRAAA
jgi:hypothetical protein